MMEMRSFRDGWETQMKRMKRSELMIRAGDEAEKVKTWSHIRRDAEEGFYPQR